MYISLTKRNKILYTQIPSHEKRHGGLPCGWRREASKEQLPKLHSHLCRSLHTVTHVWSFVIIEINNGTYNFPCIL